MSNAGQRTPAPSVSGGTRRQSINEGEAIKAVQPDLYYGERNKLDDWIMQIRTYCLIRKVPTDQQTLFATTLMRGRAQKWVKPFLKRYFDDPEDNENQDVRHWMEKFPFFVKKIQQVFGSTNDQEVAIRIVQNLKQRKAASEYAAQFQEYADLTEWDDNALMTMYRRGLKDHIKDELTRLSRSRDLTCLNDLVEESIAIDDDWYDRAMEKKYDGSQRGFSSFEPRGFSHRGRNGRRQRDPYGPMPMELDAFEKKGQSKGKKQQFRGKKALTCYGCGKPGHIARNCRSKGVVPRPQLNVLERVPDDEAGPSRRNRWDDDELNTLFQAQRILEDKVDNRIAKLESQYWKNDDGEDWKEVPDQTQERQEDPNEIQAESEAISSGSPSCVSTSSEDSEATKELIEEYRSLTNKQALGPDRNCRNDTAHPEHSTVAWTACMDKKCHTHRPGWVTAGKPIVIGCQAKRWNTCRTDHCEYHIVRKREFKCFPGHDALWQMIFRDQQQHWNKEEDECTHEQWHYCLYGDCTNPVHIQAKQYHGLAPSEKE